MHFQNPSYKKWENKIEKIDLERKGKRKKVEEYNINKIKQLERLEEKQNNEAGGVKEEKWRIRYI